ncbi:MAG: amino acid ABC transporter permease [Rhodospirillales bacterium]|nr:amino acid ABC transporter permease [Rhodospirillales bacterium]
MADLAESRLAPSEPLKPPASSTGVIGWLRANLFSSVWNSILTLIALYFLAVTVPKAVDWLLVDATWQAANGRECMAAAGGACWAAIGEKWRFILFGRFPYEEHWRPLIVCVVFVALFLASCDRRLWGMPLLAIWAAGLALNALLMWGGVFGMTYVDTSLWNGLPLTLILAVIGMAGAFPLAIVLALGRRSHMPAVRAVCVAYIELIRGVPLVTLLFMATVMLPLFLPPGITIDKLLRAQVAIILFAAAYLAEVIRGGLQSIPRGQYEAADALGLGYWQKTRLIILPQALTVVIPALVNTFIGTFKDTALVIIIGLFDLLMLANAAMTDPNWRGFATEAYLFVAAIYWAFCWFMSKYSQWLEADLNKGRRR